MSGTFREFDSTIAIILDDNEPGEDELDLPTHHQIKNQNTTSPSVALTKNFISLVEGKTRNDLVIVYFHGSAGFIDKKYSFKFQGNKSGYFNAYELIWRLSISEASCLFLLDCSVHTRVAAQWEARFPLAEVIGRGVAYVDPDGETIDVGHDFSISFLRSLRKFVAKYKSSLPSSAGPASDPAGENV